ncbi:glycosyltransferase family 2 protein [Rhodovulum euryhalinum]|uniref:Dolichol-phosphate mannosyltransferase n=1 Tax=Rhodovulum euryhalinum TaxID=35805 RepID=A0A4R2KEX2_9RHOB|nr:dolichol-phosphate mannosyltransferase [Rhodovulum euryhalinum]
MISIVIPAHDEAENVESLIREIHAACADLPCKEVIVVDDGSRDGTGDIVQGLRSEFPWLRLVRHDRAGGQSAAVHSGVAAAKGEIICTLDGDLQNPPAEIPRLVAPFLKGDADPALGLVAGQRVKRHDTWSKRAASRFANGLRGWVLSDNTRDTGCGLKAFRRDAFLALPFFNHMHRYLPALFSAHGWTIAHVDVSHRARVAGRSKYSNLQRGLVGAYDLVGVGWLLRRRKSVRPTEVAPNGQIVMQKEARMDAQPAVPRRTEKESAA